MSKSKIDYTSAVRIGLSLKMLQAQARYLDAGALASEVAIATAAFDGTEKAMSAAIASIHITAKSLDRVIAQRAEFVRVVECLTNQRNNST